MKCHFLILNSAHLMYIICTFWYTLSAMEMIPVTMEDVKSMSISHYIYFISRWATIIICMFSLTGFAQDDMPLVFNQTLSATLTPQESLAIYTFSTASADPVSITLTFSG